MVIELIDHVGNRVNLDGDVLTNGTGQPKRTLTAPPAAMEN